MKFPSVCGQNEAAFSCDGVKSLTALEKKLFTSLDLCDWMERDLLPDGSGQCLSADFFGVMESHLCHEPVCEKKRLCRNVGHP